MSPICEPGNAVGDMESLYGYQVPLNVIGQQEEYYDCETLGKKAGSKAASSTKSHSQSGQSSKMDRKGVGGSAAQNDDATIIYTTEG
ncbi:hypothetical protein WR25_20900 [Diploscapter pachys]|uniref:Uncharacterized protein n=1 Tax=Diploscapter pachys TaxID=2018661 RepID=A0A2A2L0A4_9BILA|nr:hypothetical protein WR25_20900 [Diploscapter pachys]